MSAPSMTCRAYHSHAHDTAPIDRVVLDYDARFMRRKVLITEAGQKLLVDLPQTTSLDHKGVLLLDSGGEIEVIAATEKLLQVTGNDITQLAWHIGNRHTPCQIEPSRLLIQYDHVIHDMLKLLGAELSDVNETFTPVGGAYGHGRTHSHAH